MVQLELSERLTREAEEENTDQVTAFKLMRVEVDQVAKTTISAVNTSRKHRRTTADAIVYVV